MADSNEDTTNALAQVENAVSAEAVNLTLDQIVSKEMELTGRIQSRS